MSPGRRESLLQFRPSTCSLAHSLRTLSQRHLPPQEPLVLVVLTRKPGPMPVISTVFRNFGVFGGEAQAARGEFTLVLYSWEIFDLGPGGAGLRCSDQLETCCQSPWAPEPKVNEMLVLGGAWRPPRPMTGVRAGSLDRPGRDRQKDKIRRTWSGMTLRMESCVSSKVAIGHLWLFKFISIKTK